MKYKNLSKVKKEVMEIFRKSKMIFTEKEF